MFRSVLYCAAYVSQFHISAYRYIQFRICINIYTYSWNIEFTNRMSYLPRSHIYSSSWYNREFNNEFTDWVNNNTPNIRFNVQIERWCIHWFQQKINVREYRRGNHKWTIQLGNIRYSRRRKSKQKHNTICVGHHYTQTNTNNVSKAWSHLQTTEDKDEPNIVFMWKS